MRHEAAAEKICTVSVMIWLRSVFFYTTCRSFRLLTHFCTHMAHMSFNSFNLPYTTRAILYFSKGLTSSCFWKHEIIEFVHMLCVCAYQIFRLSNVYLDFYFGEARVVSKSTVYNAYFGSSSPLDTHPASQIDKPSNENPGFSLEGLSIPRTRQRIMALAFSLIPKIFPISFPC